MAAKKQSRGAPNESVIENRRARHDYRIGDTLECGIRLRGTEVKSIREARRVLPRGGSRLKRHRSRSLCMGYTSRNIRQQVPGNTNRPAQEITRPQARDPQATSGRWKYRYDLGAIEDVFQGRTSQDPSWSCRRSSQADKRQDIERREAQRDIDRANAYDQVSVLQPLTTWI